MTIPERLERVWAKWPESRPTTCGYKMLWQPIGSTGVWHWGNDEGGQPAPGSIMLLDKAAEALAFDAMVEACGNVDATKIGEVWFVSVTRGYRMGGKGPTNLGALLSAVEKMLGLT